MTLIKSKNRTGNSWEQDVKVLCFMQIFIACRIGMKTLCQNRFFSSAEIPCLADLTTPTTAIMNSARRENIFFNFFALRDTANCSVIAVIDTINTDLAFVAPRYSGENFQRQLRNFLSKFVALIVQEFALSEIFQCICEHELVFFLVINRLFVQKMTRELQLLFVEIRLRNFATVFGTESITSRFDVDMCISRL